MTPKTLLPYFISLWFGRNNIVQHFTIFWTCLTKDECYEIYLYLQTKISK